MNQSPQPIGQRAEKVVRRLLHECRINSSPCRADAKAIARVRHAGKRLLQTLAQLNQELKTDVPEDNP